MKLKSKILDALKVYMIKLFKKSPAAMDFMLDCCTEAILSKTDKNFDDEVADECAAQLKAMIFNSGISFNS